MEYYLQSPLLDLILAVVRRVRAGRSPFSADSEHLHHKLLEMGLSHRRTAAILYLWTAAFAIPAVVSAFASFWIGLLMSVAIVALSLQLLKRKEVARSERELIQ